MERAVKHWTISARAGVEPSLKSLRKTLSKGGGYVTKVEFEKISRACYNSVNRMKSEQRDKAAALLARGLGSSMSVD